MIARIIILALAGMLIGWGAARAGDVYTPAPGTPERKAIMDALRGPVTEDLGQEVVFVVRELHVKDGWAFLFGTPRQPGLKPVDYSRTKYRQNVQDGIFDDNVSALFHKEDGRWKVVTFFIGATDAVWTPWPEDYGAPRAIFPGFE